MIKTVLIDVDDTLLDFKECSIGAIKQSMLDFNFLYKDEYYDVFQKENNSLNNERLEKQICYIV